MRRIQVELTAQQRRQRALRLIGAFSDKPDVARLHDEYLAASKPR